MKGSEGGLALLTETPSLGSEVISGSGSPTPSLPSQFLQVDGVKGAGKVQFCCIKLTRAEDCDIVFKEVHLLLRAEKL